MAPVPRLGCRQSRTRPVLGIAGQVIGLVAFVARIVALFTGRVPDGLAGVLAWYHRYSWRVLAYASGLRDKPWPDFELTVDVADPGGDPARWVAPPPADQGRVGACFVWVVGCWVVLCTGAWPRGMRDFLVGTARWGGRLGGCSYLLTDVYPPFSTQR